MGAPTGVITTGVGWGVIVEGRGIRALVLPPLLVSLVNRLGGDGRHPGVPEREQVCFSYM